MESTATVEKHENKLSYSDKVIKKIVEATANDIPGVVTVTNGVIGNIADRFRGENSAKGISAEVGDKQVAIDLNVDCEYGLDIPAIFEEVQRRESEAIGQMTGLDVVEINMHVEDVLRQNEMDKLRDSQGSVSNLLSGNKDKSE